MKYFVNEGCIGCGYCTNVCPTLFSMVGDVSVAENRDVLPEEKDDAEKAVAGCPVNVITEIY